MDFEITKFSVGEIVLTFIDFDGTGKGLIQDKINKK